MTDNINSKAFPLADEVLQKKILKIINQATHLQQLKTGGNETFKAVNRGLSEFVVLAADADPIEIVMHIPRVCEDKQVPFVFVRSKVSLGRSCGIPRKVIACSVTIKEQSQLQSHIDTIKDLINGLIL